MRPAFGEGVAAAKASKNGSLQSEGVKQRGSGAAWFDTGIAALPSGSKNRRKEADRGDDFGWSKDDAAKKQAIRSGLHRKAVIR